MQLDIYINFRSQFCASFEGTKVIYISQKKHTFQRSIFRSALDIELHQIARSDGPILRAVEI